MNTIPYSIRHKTKEHIHACARTHARTHTHSIPYMLDHYHVLGMSIR